MGKINLLPKTQQKRLYYKKLIKALRLALFMVLVFLGFFAGFLFSLNWVLESKEKDLERQLSSLLEQNQRYSFLEKEILSQEDKLLEIKKLQGGINYKDLIEKLALLTPPYCQIEKISFSQDTLKISGQAASRQQVAQFQQNLQSESQFLDVEIESASLSEGKVNFDISVKYSQQ